LQSGHRLEQASRRASFEAGIENNFWAISLFFRFEEVADRFRVEVLSRPNSVAYFGRVSTKI
jgi:hypothetical protein